MEWSIRLIPTNKVSIAAAMPLWPPPTHTPTHLSSLSLDSAQGTFCCTPLHIISSIHSMPLEFLPSLLSHPLVASHLSSSSLVFSAGRRPWVEALTVGYVAAGALLLVVPSLRCDDGVDGTTSWPRT